MRIRYSITDHGDKVADRYQVVFSGPGGVGTYARGMSADADQPNGFNMMADPGAAVYGSPIDRSALPKGTRRAIAREIRWAREWVRKQPNGG